MTPEPDAEAAIGGALRSLPLKEMDPSLLSFAIVRESAGLGRDRDVLVRAMELAAIVHRDDSRGARGPLANDPYVAHPFRLVLRLVRYGCRDVAVLCAAALHDTVEDHPQDLVALLAGPAASSQPEEGDAQRRALDLLAATFGDDVARIVAAVTNPPLPAGSPEEVRNQAYVAHVADVTANSSVFLVKFADFVDNAGSLRHLTDEDRRERLRRKYRPLIPIFRSAVDRHHEALPVGRLGPDGWTQIRQHLDAIEDWFAR